MATYFVENFGCRATQADGAAIERELLDRGIARAADQMSANVVVLNSCTVTAAADSDLRATVRKIHRENPSARILVTGCYAQRAPEEIAALPGVTWVVGNSHKASVAEIASAGLQPTQLTLDVVSNKKNVAGLAESSHFEVAQAGPADLVPVNVLSDATHATGVQVVGDIFAHTELMAAPVFESSADGTKTRPNLKVQDGCDNRCSFCVIPFVRGQSRSLKLDSVLREVHALVEAGYREMVISGINLGRWGRDFERQSRFEDLLAEILAKTTIERIRISSVEPMDWSDELISLVANSERICRHAHVPLQSGSDRVLRMMHRKYRPWHYEEKIHRIHSAMPDAAVGADVMTGFPGETDEMFEESYKFIEALPFTYLHVFTYSSRPGTAAAAMPNHLPVSVARERNKRLRELAANKNRTFREGFVGRELEMITLHKREDGYTEALSTNYLKVRVAAQVAPNEIIRSIISSVSDDGLTAVS